MTGDMPEAYEGDRDYAFVGYSHDDREAVLPIIRALVCEGYRVWYDDGIELATDYPKEIADHVYGCAFFVMFVSRASLGSKWCNDEVNYALDLGKRVLPVFLEEVELTRDLQMRIGRTQSIFWHKLSDDAFYGRLFGVRLLDCCLTGEGRRRRGVKARGDKADAGTPQADRSSRMVADKLGGVSGVVKRDKLVDYSWAELKELSRMIAVAGSDAEGLTIAREYGLVDKDGRLQGDEKPLQLKDGTKTSVRILGFRHDELVCGGKAGISFEFAGVLARHRMNAGWTNVGGWEGSEMRGWLNEEFFSQLPDDLRAYIVKAKKWTNNHGEISSLDDVTVVTSTPDGLWLMSSNEVCGGLTGVYGIEGTQYRLYADKGVSTKNCAFCKKRGADYRWWLRSPHLGFFDSFRSVYGDGDWQWYGSANNEWGVSPGFCL